MLNSGDCMRNYDFMNESIPSSLQRAPEEIFHDTISLGNCQIGFFSGQFNQSSVHRLVCLLQKSTKTSSFSHSFSIAPSVLPSQPFCGVFPTLVRLPRHCIKFASFRRPSFHKFADNHLLRLPMQRVMTTKTVSQPL